MKGTKKPTGDPSCPPHVRRAKLLQKAVEARMGVKTLGDEEEFSPSENENNHNNSNKYNNNEIQNNKSNEIITSADYSDWDDEEKIFRQSGNTGYFRGGNRSWVDESDRSDSDGGKKNYLSLRNMN